MQSLYVSLISGEYEKSRVWKFAPYRNDRVDAVHAGHLYVHQCDIRMMEVEKIDSILPVDCFGNEFNVFFMTDARFGKKIASLSRSKQ
jgi:hypothetical protein